MLKIMVPNRDFEKKKNLCLELGYVLEVKLGVLNDSELIVIMYLSLKSLIGWIMVTRVGRFSTFWEF